MMDIFISIIIGIFLSVIGIILGVVWGFTKVGPEQLADVENKCKNNGGLETAVFMPVGSAILYCKDGAKFTLKD